MIMVDILCLITSKYHERHCKEHTAIFLLNICIQAGGSSMLYLALLTDFYYFDGSVMNQEQKMLPQLI